MKMIFITLAMLPLFSQSAAPLAENPLPSIDFLSKEIPKKQQMLRPIVDNYRYIEISNSIEKNSAGKIINDEIKKYEITRINDRNIKRLVMKNGHDLTPEEAAKEEMRINKEAKEAMEKDPADPMNNIQGFFKVFKVTSLKRAIIQNKKAIILDFIPNDDFKPANTLEKMASKMVWQLIVDETTYEIIGSNGHLVSPANLLGGILASIKEGSIEMGTSIINNEIRLPSKFKTIFKIRLLFTTKELDSESIFVDHQKFSVEKGIIEKIQ